MGRKTEPQLSQFNDHLLAVRLKRVSQKNLEKFDQDVVNKNDTPKNQTKLVEEIVAYYKIMLNKTIPNFKRNLVFLSEIMSSAQKSPNI